MSNHSHDIPDAAPFPTVPYHLAQVRIDEAVETLGMAALIGDAGLGKSYAAEQAAGRHSKMRQAWIRLPIKPTMAEVGRRLVKSLTGVEEDDSRFALARRARAALCKEPWLLFVDEAQNGNLDAFEYIRDLFDDPEAQVAPIFIGGYGAWEVISRYKMFRSRTGEPILFEPMDGATVLSAIPQWHPIYANAEGELLAHVNHNLSEPGNWRCWADFTRTALRLMEQHGIEALTSEVVANALTLKGSDDES
jgi:hypothetical protein